MSRRRLRALLVVLAAFALLVRLVALGERAAHWDEARVAYWILRYAETGTWSYHPILHGPFLVHVVRPVFAVLGPSDATMRLPVALVGGLLPLAAWLFRGRLSNREVVALGALLAATPLFAFYSRFMRADVPLAAFALVALGFLVRARDTGRRRYALGAGAALGLAFTTKENAVLYLLAWLGAALGLVAYRRREGWSVDPRAARSIVRTWIRRWWLAAVVAALLWLTIVVVAYAPRTAGAGVGLWRAVDEPTLLPAVVRAATLGSARKLVSLWVLGGYQSLGPPSVLYFLHLVAILFVGAAPVALLAVVGVAVEARTRPRSLVAFATLWAGVSLLGYPLATDFAAPWIATHVALPSAIPAAVGLIAAADRVRSLRSSAIDRRLAVAVLLASAVHVAAIGPALVYAAPDSAFNPLAQPAQPAGAVAETARSAATSDCDDGPTVLYYGEYFRPGTVTEELPLAWYFAAAGRESATVRTPAAFPEEPPPVVVALEVERPFLDPRLADYRAVERELTPWVSREPGAPLVETVIYVADEPRC